MGQGGGVRYVYMPNDSGGYFTFCKPLSPKLVINKDQIRL
jgi:hypothetical protein